MAELFLVYPYTSWETLLSMDAGWFLTEYAMSKGLKPKVLSGFNCRRLAFTEMLRRNTHKGGTDLLIYLGHGNSDSLTGSAFVDSRLTDMVFAGVNEDLLVRGGKMIVCTVACKSINKLGALFLDSGGLAYVGSTEDIKVNFKDADEDSLADVVETWVMLGRDLIDGKTVADSVRRFKTCWPRDDPLMAKNLDILTYVGKGDVRYG